MQENIPHSLCCLILAFPLSGQTSLCTSATHLSFLSPPSPFTPSSLLFPACMHVPHGLLFLFPPSPPLRLHLSTHASCASFQPPLFLCPLSLSPGCSASLKLEAQILFGIPISISPAPVLFTPLLPLYHLSKITHPLPPPFHPPHPFISHLRQVGELQDVLKGTSG